MINFPDPQGPLSQGDSQLWIQMREALRLAEEEIGRLRGHASLVETREKQATEMCTWLTNENQRLRDQLQAVESRLDNWDWRGLLRDARRGDFDSMAHAMHDVVCIYDAVKGPDPEMEKP